jgi:hypothetical protein
MDGDEIARALKCEGGNGRERVHRRGRGDRLAVLPHPGKGHVERAIVNRARGIEAWQFGEVDGQKPKHCPIGGGEDDFAGADIPGIGKGVGRVVPLGRGRGPGAMRKRPKRCQKKGDDLPPSDTFTRYPPKPLRLPGGPRISQRHHPSGELRQRMEVEDVREIVGREHPPRAVGARPPGHGGGTPSVHPGRARRGRPVTPRPASARGRRRSAPHRRWCDAGRDTGGS